MKYRTSLLVVLVLVAAAAVRAQQPAQQDGEQRAFRFRTGVELINVTATVTDASGRFVAGLRQEDFRLYEDDQLQTITHFNAERVPVSLGIVLDTSGSMEGEKMLAARRALERFLFELLTEDDEVFLYTFSNVPELIQGWTTDRGRLATQLQRLRAKGGTAMYDAVAEAIPLAQAGRHRKKAILIISDGNDTSSRTDIAALKAMIRETEVLVYAIGVDTQMTTAPTTFRVPFLNQISNRIALGQGRPVPRPSPFPVPGRPRPGSPVPGYPPPPRYPPPPATPPSTRTYGRGDDRVNLAALRDITDDSGGRTELVRSARDLDPATASIADELSRQYYIGYPSSAPKDRRWHSIRLEVKNGGYLVRARKGYVATP